jgi:hypothetical protein
LGQVIIAIALLIRAIGPPALAGMAMIIVMFPIQGIVMQVHRCASEADE